MLEAEGSCFSIALGLVWLVRGSLTFAGDEADKFAHAFLHALLSLLCDFGVLRQGQFHDSGDWRKVADVSVVYIRSVWFRSARRFGRLGGQIVRHGRSVGGAVVSSLALDQW